MPGFGLEQEQEIAIFLRLLVIGEETLLGIDVIIQTTGDFVLLLVVASCQRWIHLPTSAGARALTSSSAMRFWINNAIRESR
jgi:hypothetical protein